MTFDEMDGRVVRRLQLDQGTRLGDDPFTRQDIILQAVDTACEATWCLYGKRWTSLVANQSDYCLPGFFRVDVVSVQTTAGQWQPIAQYDSPNDADALMGTWWRNDTATADAPLSGIWNGVNSITLYQMPSTTRAGGLQFEGYYAPGNVWEYSAGIALPFARTQVCPLPDMALEAAVQQAIYDCACVDDRPYILNQLPVLRDNAEDQMGSIEGKVAVFHQRSSIRARNPYTFRR